MEKAYFYGDLIAELKQLKEQGIEVGTIGKTQLGFEIPYVFLGKKTDTSLVVVGSTHAREHITTLLVMKQIRHYLKNQTVLNGGIYFVPVHNVDGVRICTEGVGFIKDEQRVKQILKVNGGHDFSNWKANADCVDLNTNFDAHWGEGSQNLFFPSPFSYVGKKPMSESENICLAEFLQKIKPDYLITYHTKGEIIFWQFFQEKLRKWRDYRLAKFVAKQTGYRLVGQTQSAGGLKDWCVEKLRIPAVTVEVGEDKYAYPYPYSQIDKIFKKNAEVPQKMLNTLAKEKKYGKKVYEAGDEGGAKGI